MTEVRALTIRAFWEMSHNINKIRAAERVCDLETAAYANSPEMDSLRKRLQEQCGKPVIAEDAPYFDKEAFSLLKRKLAGKG